MKQGSSQIIVILLVIIIAILSLFLAKDFLGGKKETPGGQTVTTSNSPKEVVEVYMKLTLGTIAGASVDYEKAKDYLADNLRQQFTDPSFIPLSYGIQDGPESVKIESENISGDTATVKVTGVYPGGPAKNWEFNLIASQGQWKIAEIKSL